MMSNQLKQLRKNYENLPSALTKLKKLPDSMQFNARYEDIFVEWEPEFENKEGKAYPNGVFFIGLGKESMERLNKMALHVQIADSMSYVIACGLRAIEKAKKDGTFQ